MKIVLLAISLFGSLGLCCTSFLNSTPQRSVMAKNFDFDYGHGLVIVNKRNVQKIATTADTREAPVYWTSKYGNVTFNQVGREFPYGGMNEKGLAIEILWLESTEYPELKPAFPTINETQWIQTMLDRASSIGEMEKLAQGMQIRSRYAKVHYFACEASGKCATFEYLAGQPVITVLDGKAVKILANDAYKLDVSKIKNLESIPEGSSSFARFARTAKLTGERSSKPLVPATFEILDKVKSPNTQWSIVYDFSNDKIFFKTKTRPSVKEISLNYFDWSCSSAVKALDINTRANADVSTVFEDISDKLNNSIVERNGFLPESLWKSIEKMPSTNHCGG